MINYGRNLNHYIYSIYITHRREHTHDEWTEMLREMWLYLLRMCVYFAENFAIKQKLLWSLFRCGLFIISSVESAQVTMITSMHFREYSIFFGIHIKFSDQNILTWADSGHVFCYFVSTSRVLSRWGIRSCWYSSSWTLTENFVPETNFPS